MLRMILRPLGLCFLIVISVSVQASDSCGPLLTQPIEVGAQWNFLPGKIELSVVPVDPILNVDEYLLSTPQKKQYSYSDFLKVTSLQKVVLYPASGFDIAGGFRMFPNATTVIGFDNHPFVDHTKTTAPQPPHPSKLKDRDWSLVTDVDNARSMATALASQLHAYFPEARVLRATEVLQEGNSHGVIEFDLGEGTLRRRFIHLQVKGSKSLNLISGISATLDLDKTFFEKFFARFSPDSMMFKASMGLNHMALGRSTEFKPESGELNEGIKTMAEYIAGQGGVIVDGDDVDARLANYSPDSLSSLLSSQLEFTLKSDDEKWGYELPRLYKFKPKNVTQ